MKNSKNLLLVAFLFISVAVLGQTKLTGTVVDSTNEPLPGASVVVKGTTNGTSTDFDGKFMLDSKTTSGTLVISYIGYKSVEVSFTSAGDMGTIQLTNDENLLEEVVVKGLIDIAKDRETPVAVSTITATEIQDKLGSQEFPELLNNTPSVYATKSGGGFGDGRINIRGFSQENIAVLINGVPVNDMENGRVFWSNWVGLSDVTTAMQVQRGLGSSKLAISSVGGTINIITKTTDKKEGGSFLVSSGNNSYIKTLATYSTGKNENGFAASFLLSRTTGEGYIEGTKFQGYNYFVGLGWDKGVHDFQFIATGAPQNHNQRTTSFFNMASLSDYLQYGRRYNYNHGYLNGQEFNWRKNFYHKPIVSFNWNWDVSENSSLTASAYLSFGRGGGTGDIGRLGGRFASDKAFRDPVTGFVQFDKIVASNSGTLTNFANGFSYGNTADPTTSTFLVNDDELSASSIPAGLSRRNGFIRRASINSHNWVGLLANYNNNLNENLSFDIGFDLRSYRGIHYRRIDNLLGAAGYRDNDDVNNPLNVLSTEYSSDLGTLWNVFKSTDNEEKINYHNDGLVRWFGAFGQVEYKNDVISAFIQGAISQQGFKRIDYFNYLNSDPARETDWKNIIGGNIKGGINWNINEQNNIYGNAGYYSKQPFFDAVFLNFRNDLNPDPRNEKIIGYELGYGFRSNKLKVNLNLYRTQWKDRFISVSSRFNGIQGNADIQGVEQIHTGAELDATYELTDRLQLIGMLSVGNWEYAGNVSGTAFDQNQTALGTINLFLDNVKVGDAAQFTSRLAVNYDVTDNFKLDYSHRFVGKLYARINAEDFSDPNHNGSLQLPGYSLGDLGGSYGWVLDEDTFESIYFRININNVFNTEYIAESATNYFPGRNGNTATFDGINTDNKVFFGFGRTWNLSIRYSF
ncbi:MAG: TonB-dependent receptor plug domain-containing protein [Flavobacteriaceae bacterium]|nr:MAG: TonB-dependent receptor plug domain-containing protein [Flavobacteriaceae bacterium]